MLRGGYWMSGGRYWVLRIIYLILNGVCCVFSDGQWVFDIAYLDV